MKYIYIILTLFITNYAFSQTEGEYNDDGITVIEITEETDKIRGYPSTTSQKAMDYYNLGVNTGQDNPYVAINYFLKSIEEDKNYVIAYDNLGRMYRYTQQYELAIKYYKESIRIFPEGNTAHINLAIVYEIMGLNEKAINEYKTAIRLDPNDPEGYYGLAMMLLYTADSYDQLEDALTNAKTALELYKKNPPTFIGDSYFQIGYIYHFLRNDIKSKEYLNLAREKYIENNMEETWQSKLEFINKL
jgi:tetratricopeptide (TPR) repeat protein